MGKNSEKLKSRRQAKRIWEKVHDSSLLPGVHVHHVDGNPFNNSPENLLACTPEEHWLIHFKQGDTVALQGKFIQFANNYHKLTKEEQREKMKKLTERKSFLWKNSPEWREKQLEQRRGIKNHFFGKIHTEQARIKIVKNRCSPKGPKHYFYGKHHSEEQIRKISESRKGKTSGINNPTWKGYVVTPEGTFTTSYEAAKVLKMNSRDIRYRCDSSNEKWISWYYEKNFQSEK